jgi:hypothetical protein
MKRTQFGWVIVSGMLITLLLIVGITLSQIPNFRQLPPMFFIIMVISAVTLIIGALLFYNLTIEVDREYIRFKMGIGLIRRKYKLSDISYCKPLEKMFVCGWGIRLLLKGTLYNVSGFKAIELGFKNKTRIVRIGTDVPQEIAEYVNKLMGNPDFTN